MIEGFKNFIKKEDPLVWKSLVIASVITIVFYVFVLIYTR